MRQLTLGVLVLACMSSGCAVRIPRGIAIPVRTNVQVDARVRIDANVRVAPQVVALENAPVPEFFGIPIDGAQDVIFVLDVSGSMADPARGQLAQLHTSPPPGPPPLPPGPPPPPPGPPPPPTDPSLNPSTIPTPDQLQPASDPSIPPAELEPPPTTTTVMVSRRKIDVAQAELVELLQRLPDGTRMNVLFFNDAIEGFAANAVALDAGSRETMITFVRRTEPFGKTALTPAMRTAFLLNAKRVVLLSDGLGNVGPDEDALIRDAREAIRGGVRIDTIGLGRGQDAELLGTLARESGGLYQQL
jgi:Mg-chelatase subunit ChlD